MCSGNSDLNNLLWTYVSDKPFKQFGGTIVKACDRLKREYGREKYIEIYGDTAWNAPDGTLLPSGMDPNGVERRLVLRLVVDAGKMLGEKPRRDPIAGLTELVDADHLDEPLLHQVVERVEVCWADFAHAAIVAVAGHQIMIDGQREMTRCTHPSQSSGESETYVRELIIQGGSAEDTVSFDQRSP